MIYQALRILSCFVFITIPSFAEINPEWKTFSDPGQEEYLTLLVQVHNVTGDVYLASPNHIYHLDADLVLKRKVIVGPGKQCNAPQINCTNIDKNYVPQSMAIAYHLDSLVICSSLYNGMCEIRPLDNLQRSSWIGPYNDRVALCTHKPGDLGYFVHGTFFSGADHDSDDVSKEERKAFFSRKALLEENGNFRFQYSHQTNVTRSAIFFNSNDTQIILYSFVYESYAYIVFTRLNRLVVETILGRVCLEDGTFHSYMEQPVTCKRIGPLGPKVYTVATAAFLGPGKERDPSSKSLYVAFVRANEGAAVCEYDMDSLNNFFKQGILDCFKKGDKTNLINLEDGTHFSCTSKPSVEDSDFCESSINSYIYHKVAFVSIPSLVMDISTLIVTALAVIVENKVKVAFIGGKPAVFAKMILGRDRGAHADHAGGNRIQGSVAFDLKQEHVYFLAMNKIVKYPMRTCSVYLTCKDCFRADADPLHCGWCDGRCAQIEDCKTADSFSRNKCSPTIKEIYPLKGPSRGGTLITILGMNFGPEDRTSNRSSVLVAGTQCRVMHWDDERILCVTKPSFMDGSGVVEVNTRDSKSTPFTYEGSARSNQTFTIVTPKLFGILPDRGSKNGGTNITIYGYNFDFGDIHRMNIQGRICSNLRVEKHTASCVTGNSTNVGVNNAIEMTIDDYVIGITADSSSPAVQFSAKQFMYLPDPEIYKIHPTEIILSFEGNITVTGRNLDSAEHPKMVVSIFSTERKLKESKENCFHTPNTDGTEMTCSFPSLDKEDTPIPKDENPSHFAQVKFVMYPFKSEFPEVESSKLWIYPDPWYEPYVNVQNVTNNQSILEIKGKYPQFKSLTEIISVQIGEEVCNVVHLTLDLLSCELPSELMTNASFWGENLSVQVQTGSNRRLLGYLKIKNPSIPEEPVEEKKTWLIALAVVLILLLVIVAAIGYIWYRRRNKERFSGCSSVISGAVTFRNDYRPVPNRHQEQPATAISLLGEATADPLLEETTAPLPPVRSFSREPSTSASTRPPFITSAVNTITLSSATAAPIGYLDMNKKNNASTVSKMIQPLEPLVANTRPELQRVVSRQNDPFDETIRLLRIDGIMLQRERLTLGEIIGSGFFGCVTEGRYNCPHKGDIHVAVKTMKEGEELTQKSIKDFLDEGIKMKDFRHEHVLGLIGICFENQLPLIVIPYMDNGDLCGYLRNPAIKLIMVADLRKFATQAAAGMAYLARYRYVHRDLAARNCVLDSDLNLKVADFGLTRDVYEKEYYAPTEKGIMPIKWMAPEAIELNRYTVKSDVWSFGVLLWEIKTRGMLPFEDIHNWNVCESIKAGLRLRQPKFCSENMYRVMWDCWQLDPEKRPSFDVLHSILKQLWDSVSDNNRRQAVTAKCAEYANCE